ncbi:hypothetical protein [Oceanobacillus salinisoli]|uniref:hypothetical protein n=1 Tax=Oceanobacillus salinisoli TaxID=2678611 RepID=UPI0012E2B8DE|nr:hypothetical protein [Oceanobacillus salinisoli]
MSNSTPFYPPSKMWLWLITPSLAIALIWTIYYTYLFIQIDLPTFALRMKLVSGIICLFLTIYLFKGYRYVCWATKQKNLLFELLQENPKILYEEFNRVFLNKTLLNDNGIDPKVFRRLHQHDYREVFEKITR